VQFDTWRFARRAQQRRKAGDAAYEKDLMAAQDIVGVLYESGERDPETLGNLRSDMDRAGHSSSRR
jgi:hypothetical protein